MRRGPAHGVALSRLHPAHVLAQHRARVTHATMRVSWPGMPQDDILAGLELLGRHVLPEVRRRAALTSA